MNMLNFDWLEPSITDREEFAKILEKYSLKDLFGVFLIDQQMQESIWPPPLRGPAYSPISSSNYSFMITIDQMRLSAKQYFLSINNTIPLGEPVDRNNFRFIGEANIGLLPHDGGYAPNNISIGLGDSGYLSYGTFTQNHKTYGAGVSTKIDIRQNGEKLFADIWVRMHVLNPDPPDYLLVLAFARFLREMRKSTDLAPYISVDLTELFNLNLRGMQLQQWAMKVNKDSVEFFFDIKPR